MKGIFVSEVPICCAAHLPPDDIAICFWHHNCLHRNAMWGCGRRSQWHFINTLPWCCPAIWKGSQVLSRCERLARVL